MRSLLVINVKFVMEICWFAGLVFSIVIFAILGNIILDANRWMSLFLFIPDIMSLLIYTSRLSPVTLANGFLLNISMIIFLLELHASSSSLNLEDGESVNPKWDNLVRAWKYFNTVITIIYFEWIHLLIIFNTLQNCRFSLYILYAFFG